MSKSCFVEQQRNMHIRLMWLLLITCLRREDGRRCSLLPSRYRRLMGGMQKGWERWICSRHLVHRERVGVRQDSHKDKLGKGEKWEENASVLTARLSIPVPSLTATFVACL
jgi:hypothetical protein